MYATDFAFIDTNNLVADPSINAPSEVRGRGRPREMRMPSAGEAADPPGQKQNRCSNCKQLGHKRTTCKAPLSDLHALMSNQRQSTSASASRRPAIAPRAAAAELAEAEPTMVGAAGAAAAASPTGAVAMATIVTTNGAPAPASARPMAAQSQMTAPAMPYGGYNPYFAAGPFSTYLPVHPYHPPSHLMYNPPPVPSFYPLPPGAVVPGMLSTSNHPSFR
jgi:hypothetical protein